MFTVTPYEPDEHYENFTDEQKEECRQKRLAKERKAKLKKPEVEDMRYSFIKMPPKPRKVKTSRNTKIFKRKQKGRGKPKLSEKQKDALAYHKWQKSWNSNLRYK